MAKEDKQKVGFNLSVSTIEKLNECLRLKNEELSLAGVTLTKQEYIEELINTDYYRLQGNSNDADTVNKINQFVDDATETKFNNIEKKLDLISFNGVRVNRLLEIFMRIAIGSKDERIQKKLGTWKGYDDPKDYDEAENQFNHWLNQMIEDPCPVVEAIDTLLYSEEDDE